MPDLPAPLVPADVDLRGMPYMPLDTVRLLNSDFLNACSGAQFKAAVCLWCASWSQIPAGSLPNVDKILQKLARVEHHWARISGAALHGFVACSDGRLYHPIICERALVAWAARQKARTAAAKRWDAQALPEHMPEHNLKHMPEHMQAKGKLLKQNALVVKVPLVDKPTDRIQNLKSLLANSTNQNPKAQPNGDGAWSASDAGIMRKATELGIKPQPGETFYTIRKHCLELIKQQLKGTPEP